MSLAPGELNFTIGAESGNLTMQADGSYLATWISGTTIWGQGFNADGSHKDGQFEIASGGAGPADISATLLSNGETIVTWVEGGSTYALRLGADGVVTRHPPRPGVGRRARSARAGCLRHRQWEL